MTSDVMTDHITIDSNGIAHLVPETPGPTSSNLNLPNRTETSGITLITVTLHFIMA